MRMARAAAALVAVSCLSIVGCSSGEDDSGPGVKSVGSAGKKIVLDPNASRAPQAVADVAIVEEGKVTIPANAVSKEWVSELKVGSVIAGNRDSKSEDLSQSKNPYGFLRKVVSIQEGNPIVIKTEQAYLPDLLEGDLKFGPGAQPSIFTDAKDITTKSLRPLANGGTSSGSGLASIVGEMKASTGPAVKLSNGQFGLDAEFTGDLRIRKWWYIPTGVEYAIAKLALNPKASVDIEVGAKVNVEFGNLQKTLEGPSVPIPLGGPIPITLRLRPEVTCSVTVTGELTVRGRAHLAGRAVAGFEYDGDLKNLYEAPTLNPGFDFIGVQGQAGMTGSCAVQAVVSILAFDAIGLEGKLGPYVSLNANVCASAGTGGVNGGFTLYEQHGLQADIDGRLQVPGLGFPSYNKNVFSFNPAKSDPRYFVGNDGTCTAPGRDSCQGRPNGLYCSEATPNSAYECRNNQIAGGQQCGTGQRCSGTANNQIQCQ